MDLSDVKVGDTLMCTSENGNDKPRPLTVVKVARKYLTVASEYGRTIQYDIATGEKNSQWSGYAQTVEAHAKNVERGGLVKELRNVGIIFDYSSPKFSVDQLRAIVAIVIPDPEDQS